MTGLRKLLGMMAVAFVAVTILGFGGETRKATADPIQGYDALSPGLTASDWGKNERHLSGLLEEIKLTASDAQANDIFGNSVAIGNDTVIVGAALEDGGPGDPLLNTGAAYIFERNQGGVNNWGQVAELTAGDPQAQDRFGWSVSISGDTVIVGALYESGGPGDPLPRTGAAYIFDRNQGGTDNWGQVAKLISGDAQVAGEFGIAVAVDGDTVIVGAALENGEPDDPLPNSGTAYIFERNQGGANNWGQAAKLTAGDAQADAIFGISVAISNDTVIVGASEDGGPGDPLPDAGAAYIFERNHGGAENWGQTAKLTAGDAQAGDYFGDSVAISGDTVFVGAYGEDGGLGNPLSEAGAAYIFERDQGGANNWGQVVKLTASDTQAVDFFGISVAISGDTVIAGAFEDGGPGDPLSDAGAAYVFTGEFEVPTDVTTTSFDRPNSIGGSLFWVLGCLVLLMLVIGGKRKIGFFNLFR